MAKWTELVNGIYTTVIVEDPSGTVPSQLALKVGDAYIWYSDGFISRVEFDSLEDVFGFSAKVTEQAAIEYAKSYEVVSMIEDVLEGTNPLSEQVDTIKALISSNRPNLEKGIKELIKEYTPDASASLKHYLISGDDLESLIATVKGSDKSASEQS